MLAMVKIVLLLLVVFKAAALENSRETDSDHELFSYISSSPSPSPFSYPPELSTSVGEQKATDGCLAKCLLSCMNKGFFGKAMCIANCYTKCFSAPDSHTESDCIVDCVQSSTNNLRNDANMMNDRVTSSCQELCKRD